MGCCASTPAAPPPRARTVAPQAPVKGVGDEGAADGHAQQAQPGSDAAAREVTAAAAGKTVVLQQEAQQEVQGEGAPPSPAGEEVEFDYKGAIQECFPVFYKNHTIGEEVGRGMGSATFLITPNPGVLVGGGLDDTVMRTHIAINSLENSLRTSTTPLANGTASRSVLPDAQMVSSSPITSPGEPGSSLLPQKHSRFGSDVPAKLDSPDVHIQAVDSPPSPADDGASKTGEDTLRSEYATLNRTTSRDDLRVGGGYRQRISPSGRLCCKITSAAVTEEDTKQHWKEVVAYSSLSRSGVDENILQVYDHFMNTKYSVVIAQYMEGGPLDVSKKYPEPVVAAVALQVLSVLEDMHRAGYCHLDIKPSHILSHHAVTPDTPTADVNVSLSGFGCCTRFVRYLATLGEIPESPLYIAPEVWKIVMSAAMAGRYDERCDMWSLGIIVYQMLSGRHPFIAETPSQTFSEDDYVKLFEAFYPEDADEPVVKFPSPEFDDVSNEAKHFLLELLAVDYTARANAAQALNHPFVRKHNPDLKYLGGVTKNRLLFHYEAETRSDVDVSGLTEYMKMPPPAPPAIICTSPADDGLCNLLAEIESNLSDGADSHADGRTSKQTSPDPGPSPPPFPGRRGSHDNRHSANQPGSITSLGSFNRPRRPSWQAEAHSSNGDMSALGGARGTSNSHLVVELNIVGDGASQQQFSIQEAIGKIKSPCRTRAGSIMAGLPASPKARSVCAPTLREFPKERAYNDRGAMSPKVGRSRAASLLSPLDPPGNAHLSFQPQLSNVSSSAASFSTDDGFPVQLCLPPRAVAKTPNSSSASGGTIPKSPEVVGGADAKSPTMSVSAQDSGLGAMSLVSPSLVSPVDYSQQVLSPAFAGQKTDDDETFATLATSFDPSGQVTYSTS